MPNRVKILLFVFVLAVAAAYALWAGCKSGDGTASSDTGQSVVETENVPPEESIDWSTVTPEQLFDGVTELYQSGDPTAALVLLERGVNHGVTTDLEAEQVRAQLLYELGRLDDAFLALANYRIDASRPDLLQLRAEVLWGMSRYADAGLDLEILLEAQGDEPSSEVLFSLARLYEEMGEWDKSKSMREKLMARGQDPLALVLSLQTAIQSNDPAWIESTSNALATSLGDQAAGNSLLAFAGSYQAYLSGDRTEALRIASDYLAQQGFDLNLSSIQLRIDAENGDFAKWESDLKASLEQLHATVWVDTPAEKYPPPAEQPMAVAGLLDYAAALELGRGNRDKAGLLAERAQHLNPYDYSALLQLAAARMTQNDMSAAFELLNEAVKLAPASDIRTRLRMIQFSRLAVSNVKPPWDEEALVGQLEKDVRHFEERYPKNGFCRSARAELAGCRGDIEGAASIYEEACAMPGATREMFFRWAYFLARSGRLEEAWKVVESHLPPQSPDLTWASQLELEARVNSDDVLKQFASLVRDRLDPKGEHSEFFAPVAGE